MALREYREKRPAGHSPEPCGRQRKRRRRRGAPRFVIQHHAASSDHYDFRLGKDAAWLLVKKSDEDADGRRKPIRRQPESVLSGRTLDELS